MPRTKGSLNKSTIAKNSGVYTVNLEKQVEGSPITKSDVRGWRNWGLRNNMPTLLLDLYNQSPTHRACINFEVQSIVGGGIDIEQMKVEGNQIAPNYFQDWNTLLRSIALDYSLYGTYCIEIIQNKDRKTYSYYHIPADKVRWSEYDEDGQITSYWIASDWSEIGKYPPMRIDAFDMREDFKIEGGKPYLYVYRPYTPAMTFYTQPRYQAGIKSIQSEVEFCNFDLRSATNSFVPSGMLLLNEVSDDEQRRAIINNVQKLFVGTDNAAQVMVSFRSNIEEKEPTFVPFTANQGNVNLFDASNERTIDRIVSSHQIPSKTLIGLSNKNTGFNSEGAFLEAAYQLYNTLVGNYDRDAIVKTINFMLRMNGIEQELILKPLKFSLDDEKAEQPIQNNDRDSKVDDSDVNENRTSNIEEMKDGNNTKNK